MRLWFFASMLFLGFSSVALISQDEAEEKIPDIFMFDKVGKMIKVNKCQDYFIMYGDVEPENTYIKYIETATDDEYMLLLSSLSTQASLKPVDLTESIEVPSDGSTPIASKSPISGATRKIVFEYIEQVEEVYTGELINIEYTDGINLDKVYISYSSNDEGYILKLARLNEVQVIKFQKRCQKFVVANPAVTTIRYADEVQYEQIIWTPRVDGSWEVRMGTTGEGCNSPALDRIKALRTPEYMINVPVESKNINK